MKKNPFIAVNGRQFELAGKPYYVIGANMWYGCYLGATKDGRIRLRKELDLLQSAGINNLRVMGGVENSPLKNTLKPAIQSRPGVYNKSLLKGLDYLLAEMKKRDMSAVVYLTNYWDWTGGMAQYVTWQKQQPLVHPEKGSSYGDFMKYAATFYENNGAQRDYQCFIKDLLFRKNTFTKLLYKDDPVIMAWELSNEPRPHPDGKLEPQKFKNFNDWIDRSAKYIKSLDKNHLVTTGSEGTKGCLESEECFVKAHSSRSIDYICIHLWPRNWGWWNQEKMKESLIYSEKESMKYIDQQLRLTDSLHKPMVLEEFGLDRDYGSNDSSAPVTARNHFFKVVFDKICKVASAGGSLVGSNFWAWGGLGRSPRKDFKWRKGDPFTGDPILEPQGRNSVFDSDTDTLQVIREHANQFKSL